MARASEVTRGDLWYVHFDVGPHPGLLIGRTGAMRRRQRAIVALTTSEGLGLPTEVAVGPQHGLDHDSVVDCEDLFTVPLSALDRRIGELDPDTLAGVDAALRLALDLRQ
ncbi:MAG TPA: type II toxin-antitoxin system PemK/MazF family toxin [Chloroflexota bacterium]|jgi:mRNA interferase MazF